MADSAYEILTSEKISSLCQGINQLLDLGADEKSCSKYLDMLGRLVGQGAGQGDPVTMLSCLIRDPQVLLNMDPCQAERLTSILLHLSPPPFGLLASLAEGDRGRNVTSLCWSHPDFPQAEAEIVETFLSHSTVQLEGIILQGYKDIFYKKSISSSEFWRRNSHLIKWSSQSKIIFQVVTSMMNEILSKSKWLSSHSKIASDFVNSVIEFCSNNKLDFISLYPLEISYVVTVLQNDIYFLEEDAKFKNEIIFILQELAKNNSFAMAGLLTHFPKWLKYSREIFST